MYFRSRLIFMVLMAVVLMMPMAAWALTADDYNVRGVQYVRQGNYEKAVDEFTSALIMDPTSNKSYNNRGGVYMFMQKYELALEDFNKAIALSPYYAKAYNNRAYVNIKLGKLDEAIEDANKAIGLAPGEATFYETRGYAYAGKKIFEAALKDFDKALEIAPKLADAIFHRAQVYDELGRTSEACAGYDAYIKLVTDEKDPDLQTAKQRLVQLSQTQK